MLTDEPFPLNGEGFRLGWKLVDLSDKINSCQQLSCMRSWEVRNISWLTILISPPKMKMI